MTKEQPKFDLVAFDLDGVLADYESSWVWMHKHFITNNDTSLEAYNRGEIDDQEFMRRDIALWLTKAKPLHSSKIEEILQDIPTMKGAQQTIQKLKDAGTEVVMVSAGLRQLAERIAKETGIEHIMVNDLELDKEGYLTGEGILEVTLNNKGKHLNDLLIKLNVPPERCAAVGNSSIDITMFNLVKLGIAFNPADEEVKRAAQIVIEERDLTRTLEHLI